MRLQANIKPSPVLVCRIFASLPGFGCLLLENNFKSRTPNSWCKHLRGREHWKWQGNVLPSKSQTHPQGRQAPAATSSSLGGGQRRSRGEAARRAQKAHYGGLRLKARTPIYCILPPSTAKRRTVKPEVQNGHREEGREAEAARCRGAPAGSCLRRTGAAAPERSQKTKATRARAAARRDGGRLWPGGRGSPGGLRDGSGVSPRPGECC